MPFRRRVVQVGIASAAWATGALPARALEGHLGAFVAPATLPPGHAWIAGADLELGPRRGAWSIGTVAWQQVGVGMTLGGTTSVTAYGKTRFPLGPELEGGVLVGPSYLPTGWNAVAGLSLTRQGDRWWVTLSPNYLLVPARGLDPWFGSGLPWAEAGYKLSEHAGLGLGLGLGLIRLSYRL